MKLTINHLKGYLDHKLKFVRIGEEIQFTLDGIYSNGDVYSEDLGEISIELIKPLLHPLSSLTKYREDLGFVPIDEIKPSQHHLFFREDLEFPMDGLQYSEIKKLQQWHIDYQNLIKENLAIEIN